MNRPVDYPCPTCKALPGFPCRTVTGTVAPAEHTSRVQAARSAPKPATALAVATRKLTAIRGAHQQHGRTCLADDQPWPCPTIRILNT